MNSMFEYITGAGDTQFFRELFAFPDTVIKESDETDVKLIKSKKRLSKLRSIADMLEQPGWQILEETLLGMVKQHDNKVWAALIENDAHYLERLKAERVGIVALFEAVNDTTYNIKKIVEDISKLEKGDNPQPPTSEDLQ